MKAMTSPRLLNFTMHSHKRSKKMLAALLLLFALQVFSGLPSYSQPSVSAAGDITPRYTSNPLPEEAKSDNVPVGDLPTDQSISPQELDSLVAQAASQNISVTSFVDGLFQTTGLPQPIVNLLVDLFKQFGSIIKKWIEDFNSGWAAPAAGTLVGILHKLVLNPNVAVPLTQSQSTQDTVTPGIQQLFSINYAIAQDLLLLMFIFCIWKFWVDAAWKGGNVMGPVGRLIFTGLLMLAWPDIYMWIIQVSNEMIQAIYPTTAQDMQSLVRAVTGAIDTGAVATVAGLVAALAPVVGAVGGGLIAGAMGGVIGGFAGSAIAFAAELIFLILATIIVFELIYIIILKAMQIVLLYAQYMFAPIFLLFFVHPETENIAINYMRALVEVSLWSFVWVGELRILAIVMNSNYAIWGTILLAIAVLQLMINVPEFIAHAKISPVSDFISSGFLSAELIGGMRNTFRRTQSGFQNLSSYFAGQRLAASDIGRSQTTLIGPLAGGAGAGLVGRLNAISSQGQPFSAGTGGGLGGGPVSSGGTPIGGGPPGRFGGGGGMMLGTSTGGPVPGSGGGAAFAALGTGAVLGAALGGSGADPFTSHGPTSRYDEKGNVFEPIKDLSRRIFDRKKGAYINYQTAGNYIHSDPRGNVHIGVRAGAKPEEIGRMHAIAALSDIINDDPIAMGAARDSAIDAKEDRPIGAFERGVAGLTAHYGRNYKASDHARQSFQRGLARQATLGAQAYISGEAGNQYTQHLIRRFGPWTPEKDGWAAHIATNMDDPNSGYHPAYKQATDAVLQSGELFTDPRRAAAANPHVMAMRPYDRKPAIAAVAKVSEDVARATNPGASQKELDAAIGRIAMSWGPEMVAAATAIQLESGGRDVSYDSVQNVNSLWTSRYVTNPSAGYHVLDAAMRGIGGGGAARSTIHAAMYAQSTPFDYSRATSFIQNMAMAGFGEPLMRSPDVVHLAYQMSPEGGGNVDLPVIASAYRALGTGYVNENTVHTVNSMINSGWRSRDIERPAVWSAQALIKEGYTPTRNLVRVVMEHPNWQPAPDQTLSPTVAADVQNAFDRRR